MGVMNKASTAVLKMPFVVFFVLSKSFNVCCSEDAWRTIFLDRGEINDFRAIRTDSEGKEGGRGGRGNWQEC